MKINAYVCGLIVAAGLIASHPALAAEGDISVGGQILFTIKAPAAGASIAARADAVSDRLGAIIANPYLRSSDIHLVQQADRSVLLMVGKRLLVTVTPEDGRINQLSAWDQARIWRNELRQNLPKVNVKPPHDFPRHH